jgi:hypothetical protein
MPFLNALKELEHGISSSDNKSEFIKHNEIASSMSGMGFVTMNASNDFPDMVSFTFISPRLVSIRYNDDGEILLSYKWDVMKYENLMEKYFSSNMALKYENKAPKEVSNDVTPMKRTIRCSECGNEMSVYDGDITKYDYGRAICPDCLMKLIGEK